MKTLQEGGVASTAILRELAVDVIDRIEFLQVSPRTALVVGDVTGSVSTHLAEQGVIVSRNDPAEGVAERTIDEEQPLPGPATDLIVSLGLLDTVNDLPGALVLMRRALAPGGVMIATMCGAGSLPALKQAFLAADGDRPAARIHPQVDVRAAGQLLNRTGFSAPVVDGWGFEIAYPDIRELVGDLRAQGLGNVLADSAPPVGRRALARANAAFASMAGPDGMVLERFEMVTMTGRSPLPPA